MSAAYEEALAAARELSNPEGRRGYKRTSGLAALVAAQIAIELQPIVTYCDGHVEAAASMDLRDAGEATKRIETLCRAMVGDLVEADATPTDLTPKERELIERRFGVRK